MAKVYSALVECCCIAQSQREEAGWQAGRTATILVIEGKHRQSKAKSWQGVGIVTHSIIHFLLAPPAFRQVIMYD